MIDVGEIRRRFLSVSPLLDERQRRLFAAAEAKAAGYGGISAVARATGMAISTIRHGCQELDSPLDLPNGKVRRPGGGAKGVAANDPQVLVDLLALVEPSTRGDPMSPLRWVSKGLRKLAAELRKKGHKISHVVVGKLLKAMHFSLQANRKTLEGADHPDRDAQFRHINELAREALADRQPVISVDTKKKELVGNFKNGGQEWEPEGKPTETEVHDFVNKDLGRAVPYGVYDINANSGWVSVGINHDTGEFAVQAIRRWWQEMGCMRYPNASYLVITADGGGSNGSRLRLWKRELQKLADEIGIDIIVAHFPPGTSKWNKIEHRLFSNITINWRAKPLVSYQVILQLIAATTTKTGLTVRSELDDKVYEKGIKVSDAEFNALNITRDSFHGEWNYAISPRVIPAASG
jgi:hypothetical protein